MALGLMTSASYAQVTKGAVLIGGGLNFSSTTSSYEFDGKEVENVETKYTDLGLTPKVGYLLTDNIAVGVMVDFSNSKITSTFENSEIESTANGIAAGPFVRYYTALGIFGEAGVGLGSMTTNGGGEDEKDLKSSLFGWNVGLGYAAFLNDHISVEPMIGYGSNSWTTDVDGKDSVEKNAGINFGVSLGIYLQ